MSPKWEGGLLNQIKYLKLKYPLINSQCIENPIIQVLVLQSIANAWTI